MFLMEVIMKKYLAAILLLVPCAPLSAAYAGMADDIKVINAILAGETVESSAEDRLLTAQQALVSAEDTQDLRVALRELCLEHRAKAAVGPTLAPYLNGLGSPSRKEKKHLVAKPSMRNTAATLTREHYEENTLALDRKLEVLDAQFAAGDILEAQYKKERRQALLEKAQYARKLSKQLNGRDAAYRQRN